MAVETETRPQMAKKWDGVTVIIDLDFRDRDADESGNGGPTGLMSELFEALKPLIDQGLRVRCTMDPDELK